MPFRGLTLLTRASWRLNFALLRPSLCAPGGLRAQERTHRRGDKKESGVRGQEFGDLRPQASSLPSPQMNTDSNGKPDLTRESSTEEGPGGTGRNVERSQASSLRPQAFVRHRWTLIGAEIGSTKSETRRATESHGGERDLARSQESGAASSAGSGSFARHSAALAS